jgi:hypothetical protein
MSFIIQQFEAPMGRIFTGKWLMRCGKSGAWDLLGFSEALNSPI